MKLAKNLTQLCLAATVAASFAITAPVIADEQSHRSDKNQARDKYRQPYRTLEFFGVKATDKVVEIIFDLDNVKKVA